MSKGEYFPSSSHKDFNQNLGNILILLELVEKVQKIDFTDEEIESYEKLVRMWYTNKNYKTQEMKGNIAEILREQSIIAGVSNWEGYFSDVSEIILNDKVLEKIYNDKEKLKKFLNKFNLKHDFADQMFLNGYQFKDLKFASYIKKNKKINYQDIEELKIFLNILYDNDIVNIDKKIWTGITNFIKARHYIVHKAHKVHQTYSKKEIEEIIKIINSKEEIEKIINNMSKLINEIDKTLFTQYKK